MNDGLSSGGSLAPTVLPGVLALLAAAPRRLGDQELKISGIWDESSALKAGLIEKFPAKWAVYPEITSDAVLSDQHLFVGNPLFNCPDDSDSGSTQWHNPDLNAISSNYLPRCFYHSGSSGTEYLHRIDSFQGRPVIRFFRLGLRKNISGSGIRTLTACLLSQGVAHLDTVESICFKDEVELVCTSAILSSLPLDFYVRAQHREELNPEFLKTLPLPELSPVLKVLLCARTLCLNCLTIWYNGLWERQFKEEFRQQRWSRSSPGLREDFFAGLTTHWSPGCALRCDLERRQALVEIDVITAKALGLKLGDLLSIYNSGFRELKAFDQGNWYDQNGRMIYSGDCSKLKRGLPLDKKALSPGVVCSVNGLEQPEGLGFEDVKELKTGEVKVSFDDCTLPDRPRCSICWKAPFFCCDMEEDYRRAWELFPDP